MNDFTEDELHFIHDLIHDFLIGREHETANSSWMKLKSMIDNYCAHDRPYTKLGITVCLGCQRIIKDE